MAVMWPRGVTSAGIPCGIKDGAADLGMLVFEDPIDWAGVFTSNAAAAAPVEWSRSSLGRSARALVVNSGNANACTGERGRQAVRTTARHAAGVLGCSASEVLIASTGPIGVHLPVGKVISGVDEAVGHLGPDPQDFARAIMTTDTFPKIVERDLEEARFVGVAKGAAMIAPRMATMLAFIVTDARLGPGSGDALRAAVDRTFNRISIDGCESTNDSVFLFGTGSGPVLAAASLDEALTEICSDLAAMMLKDAEGGSKVIEIEVTGAPDEGEAHRLARTVVSSNLWRAATHGADPNWGRIASALGTVLGGNQLSGLSITIGPEEVFAEGEPTGSLEIARKAMEQETFKVVCDLGLGSSSASMFTVDLSPEYVALNAEGTT